VGMPDCIRQGQETARNVLAYLSQHSDVVKVPSHARHMIRSP
jgi:hypothetical protein